MTIKQWNDMTQPGWDQKATAEAKAAHADAPPPAEAPVADAPVPDPLAGVRGALEMPDATEEEIITRIEDLRKQQPNTRAVTRNA